MVLDRHILFRGLVVIVVAVLMAIGLGRVVAQAQPYGGWGPGGPTTALGQADFLGCHFLYNFEYATLNGALGSGQFGDADVNIFQAIGNFNLAYGSDGGSLYTEGYLLAYTTALRQEWDNHQAPNPSYEANANNLCSPITSGIPENPNNWSSFKDPQDGKPVRWSGCSPNGQITIAADSWITGRVDMEGVATTLRALTGWNVVYSPALGSNANEWVHAVSSLPGHDVGLTHINFTYPGDQLVHSDSAILNTLSGNSLIETVNHETGLSMGLGEPANGTVGANQEVMDTTAGSNWFFQAGDWTSGIVAGVGFAYC